MMDEQPGIRTRRKWRTLAIGFSVLAITVFLFTVYMISKLCQRQQHQGANTSLTSCLRESFKGVVLVIVYNYPFYSSIPLLKGLYSGAFPTIMFCGPKMADNETYPVEEVYHDKGYFAYVCLARAMEKYPSDAVEPESYTEGFSGSRGNHGNSYHGYLVINDDIMLNFWNLVSLDRTKIWEGPRVPIIYPGFVPRKNWYWWKSRWGMPQCKKAYDELWALRKDFNTWSGLNITKSLEILTKNGVGRKYCYRGRSDVFYVPRQFSHMFQLLAYVFYKQSVFLEIAIPTMLRMLNLEVHFEHIPGVYLPGRANESFVMDSKYFWQVYNRKEYFVHPLKLNHADAELNRALVKTWIADYIERITQC